MSGFAALFAAILGVGSALAWIGVRAPRTVTGKLGTLALAALFLPLAYLGLAELLGRPKPVALEWLEAGAGEATVLASAMEEGRQIHLWLRLHGAPEPRAYALPWSQRLAQELQEAGREAAARGTALRMRLPFAAGLDPDEPRFHAEPQPRLPEKEIPPTALAFPGRG